MNFEKLSADTSMDTGSENRSSQTIKQEQKRIIKEVMVRFIKLKCIFIELRLLNWHQSRQTMLSSGIT